MEACVVICRTAKPAEREGKILLINAVDDVTRERAQSFLTDGHIERIAGAYRAFGDEDGFASVATVDECLDHDGNLSIPLYVNYAPIGDKENGDATAAPDLAGALEAWLESSRRIRGALHGLITEQRL
jgi:type I restriction enzyme M protein